LGLERKIANLKSTRYQHVSPDQGQYLDGVARTSDWAIDRIACKWIQKGGRTSGATITDAAGKVIRSAIFAPGRNFEEGQVARDGDKVGKFGEERRWHYYQRPTTPGTPHADLHVETD